MKIYGMQLHMTFMAHGHADEHTVASYFSWTLWDWAFLDANALASQ